MAFTLEQEAALLALLDEKRITLPELPATTEVKGEDLLLTNQLLADKSVTAKVLKEYIAPPATLNGQGVVQLSSAIDSDSEVTTATSKAVKKVNDNANTRALASRTINGNPLNDDVIISSQDIFGRAENIGAGMDLNDYKRPGIYRQDLNTNTSLEQNYPEAWAGSLVVYPAAGIVQVYHVYNSSRVYTRAYYMGNWTSWAKEYNSLNPPLLNTASKASSGWWKCANTGIIMQWGSFSTAPEGTVFNFPIAFPNGVKSLTASEIANTTSFTGVNFSNSTATSAKIRGWNAAAGAGIKMTLTWFAIGY